MSGCGEMEIEGDREGSLVDRRGSAPGRHCAPFPRNCAQLGIRLNSAQFHARDIGRNSRKRRGRNRD